MTVRVSKPAFKLRDKLSELDKPVGLKGTELMRSETVQDVRNLVSAGRKNKFINGSMRIAQRGTSHSLNTDNAYSLDRIKHIVRGTHDSTYTQSADHPDGFSKSLKISPNSTYTPSGSDNASFQSFIEGQDLQDLQFGTSNAKPFTVSFYAKSASSNNGHQYTFQIRTYPTSGETRVKNFPFIVTTTWQRFIFTFTGDQTKDIADTSSNGFACLWNLDAGPDDIQPQYTDWYDIGKFQCVTGQSHFQDNTSNEFYLTGVQIEVGDEATEFEHLSYDEDLARCERYCQKYGDGWWFTGFHRGAGYAEYGYCMLPLRTTMRSGSISVAAEGDNLQGYRYVPGGYKNVTLGSGRTATHIVMSGTQSTQMASLRIQWQSGHGWSDGDIVHYMSSNADTFLTLSAEL